MSIMLPQMPKQTGDADRDTKQLYQYVQRIVTTLNQSLNSLDSSNFVPTLQKNIDGSAIQDACNTVEEELVALINSRTS